MLGKEREMGVGYSELPNQVGFADKTQLDHFGNLLGDVGKG